MRLCCPSSCCPGGAKGAGGAGVLLLAVVIAEVIMHVAVFLIAATVVLVAGGFVSVGAVMVFYAYLTRDQAKAGAQLEARREARALAAREGRRIIAASSPQAIGGTTPAAIEHHYHGPVINVNGLSERDMAAVFRALPADAGGIIISKEQLCAGQVQKGDAAAPAAGQEPAAPPRRPTGRPGLRSTPASAATAS
jgi:hypothetical protein